MAFAIPIYWWSPVVRGVVAVLLGIVALAWPGITLGAIVLLFGAYALIHGIVSLAGIWRPAGTHERWGALLFEGIVGIAAAIVTIAWPAITLLSLIYVIAAWAIITGIFEVVAAIRLRKHISHEWLLALGGVASIVFGILVMRLSDHRSVGDGNLVGCLRYLLRSDAHRPRAAASLLVESRRLGSTSGRVLLTAERPGVYMPFSAFIFQGLDIW